MFNWIKKKSDLDIILEQIDSGSDKAVETIILYLNEVPRYDLSQIDLNTVRILKKLKEIEERLEKYEQTNSD